MKASFPISICYRIQNLRFLGREDTAKWQVGKKHEREAATCKKCDLQRQVDGRVGGRYFCLRPFSTNFLENFSYTATKIDKAISFLIKCEQSYKHSKLYYSNSQVWSCCNHELLPSHPRYNEFYNLQLTFQDLVCDLMVAN